MNQEKGLKIIITDPVDQVLIERLEKENFGVDYYPKIKDDELINVIEKYNGIVVRSRTKVTRDLINKGKNLKFVARAGVGLYCNWGAVFVIAADKKYVLSHKSKSPDKDVSSKITTRYVAQVKR